LELLKRFFQAYPQFLEAPALLFPFFALAFRWGLGTGGILLRARSVLSCSTDNF
jgi:hypothetical protein